MTRTGAGRQMLIKALSDLGVSATPSRIESVRQRGFAPPLVRGQTPTRRTVEQYAAAITLTGQGRSTEGVALALCAQRFDVATEIVQADYIAVFDLADTVPDWSGEMTDADFESAERMRKALDRRQHDAPDTGISRQLGAFKANIGAHRPRLTAGETADERRESFVENLVIATFGGELTNPEVVNEAGGFPPGTNRNPRYLTQVKMLRALAPDVWPRIVDAARILYRSYLETEPAETRLMGKYFTGSDIALELLAFAHAVDIWIHRFTLVRATTGERSETDA